MHTEFTQLVTPGQTTPQAPQFMLLLVVFTSHPLPGRVSQFAKPELHTKVHWLLEHIGVAFWAGGHTVPQLPQLFASEVGFTSQPLPFMPSQLRNGELQVMPHIAMVQKGVELGGVGHIRPQLPQLLTLFWVLTSQPSALLRLQFAKPESQLIVHMPPWQRPVAFGAPGHCPLVWQLPGCVVLVLVVLVLLVVVVVGTGTGAQRRLVDLTVTLWVPNWSCTVAVGDAFAHLTL
jgi:hypothetical protein